MGSSRQRCCRLARQGPATKTNSSLMKRSMHRQSLAWTAKGSLRKGRQRASNLPSSRSWARRRCQASELTKAFASAQSWWPFGAQWASPVSFGYNTFRSWMSRSRWAQHRGVARCALPFLVLGGLRAAYCPACWATLGYSNGPPKPRLVAASGQ